MPKTREAAADTSVWPLLRRERTWGPWRLGLALATAAAATWCYLIGGYAGNYLNFFQGSLALTAGSMIGMLLVLLRCGADLHPIRHRVGRFHKAAVRLEGLDDPGADAAPVDHRLERDAADLLREVADAAPLGARLAASGTRGHAGRPVHDG